MADKKRTKAEQRVALAKDVLLKLKAKEIEADFGVYRSVGDDAACRVCGVGSLVVACCNPDGYVDSCRVVECLRDTFPVSQLALIEAAFEGSDCVPIVDDYHVGATRSIRAAARMFPGKRFRYDDDCFEVSNARLARSVLVKIMRNIIANNGTFRVGLAK